MPEVHFKQSLEPVKTDGPAYWHKHLKLFRDASTASAIPRTTPPPQFSDSRFPKGMSLADLPSQLWVHPRYAALEPVSDPLRARQLHIHGVLDRSLARHRLAWENGVSELNPKYSLGLVLRS